MKKECFVFVVVSYFFLDKECESLCICIFVLFLIGCGVVFCGFGFFGKFIVLVSLVEGGVDEILIGNMKIIVLFEIFCDE